MTRNAKAHFLARLICVCVQAECRIEDVAVAKGAEIHLTKLTTAYVLVICADMLAEFCTLTDTVIYITDGRVIQVAE